ncbi:hypothetical protein RJ639_002063, partial [Escallonia herrerae]
MHPKLYNAAAEGKVNDLQEFRDHLESVNWLLANAPLLLCRVNAKGSTPPHVSAREGRSEIVQALIESLDRGGQGDAENGERDGDTALHEAMQFRHLDVADVLVREDPQFSHPPNRSQETPLYLAAEKGLDDCVCRILNACRAAPSYGGPGGRTALHAAVIFDSEGSTRALLNWSRGRLAKAADEHGWTPIHYASRLGHENRVRQIFLSDERSKEMAYLTAEGDEKKTALHLAASHGHIDVVMFLYFHCPDCAEMVTSRGQNIFILQLRMSESILINQKDNDGIIPLHLLAASSNYFQWGLVTDPRVETMAFNNENLTPLDIACSDKYGSPF